jgi:hypothetical protein
MVFCELTRGMEHLLHIILAVKRVKYSLLPCRSMLEPAWKSSFLPFWQQRLDAP